MPPPPPPHTHTHTDVPQIQITTANQSAVYTEQPEPIHHKPIPDLKDLFKELYNTADKWEDIGILLGIQPGRLDAIKMSESKAQSCLREMLKIWLKNVSPPPLWSAIADAVESLGDQELATRLRRKYI